MRWVLQIGDDWSTWEMDTTAPSLYGKTDIRVALDRQNFKDDLSGKVIAAKGDDCDLNLIESRNKVLVCLCCPLDNRKKEFRSESGLTMVGHLMHHNQINQRVPSSVIARLLLRAADGR